MGRGKVTGLGAQTEERMDTMTVCGRTADAIMSHGVQLPDVFEVLPREEAQRECQRELATTRVLCLKLLAEKALVV